MSDAINPAGRRPLTSGESGLVGAISGVIEVCINQPTVAWKNALQQSRPLIVTPRELYRGLTINASSIAPVTAVQFGANQFLLSAICSDASNPSSFEQIACAAAAGVASAVVSTPAELVMIRQQRRQAGLLPTAKNSLLTTPFRGFTHGAMREAIFTVGYLGVAPVFGRYVGAILYPNSDSPPGWTRTCGSAIAGVLAGTASHAFDTIKTSIQGAEKGEPWKTAPVVKKLMKEGGGFKGLFSGLFPRGLRITIGVIVLSFFYHP